MFSISGMKIKLFSKFPLMFHIQPFWSASLICESIDKMFDGMAWDDLPQLSCMAI